MSFKFGRKCVLKPQKFGRGTWILGYIIFNGGSHMFHSENGPPAGFCESNDTTLALCGLDGAEKTSPDETHIFGLT